MIERYSALSEYSGLNPWFPSLVRGLLSNWINYLKEEKVVTSKLDNLSNSEAFAIGKSFAKALDMSTSATTGCDFWQKQYPAMVELCARDKFVLPMVVAIGQRKMIEAPWGLILRVAVGAILSTLDIATDITSIHLFYEQERYSFALATLGMILLCMLLQTTMAFVQYRRRGWRKKLTEVLYIVLSVKPLVDAFEIARGTLRHDLDDFDPKLSILVSKVFEMFAESIPASVVQIYG